MNLNSEHEAHAAMLRAMGVTDISNVTKAVLTLSPDGAELVVTRVLNSEQCAKAAEALPAIKVVVR
jgi:hypothetical protein